MAHKLYLSALYGTTVLAVLWVGLAWMALIHDRRVWTQYRDDRYLADECQALEGHQPEAAQEPDPTDFDPDAYLKAKKTIDELRKAGKSQCPFWDRFITTSPDRQPFDNGGTWLFSSPVTQRPVRGGLAIGLPMLVPALLFASRRWVRWLRAPT